jgi:hypothetical protein
MEQKKLGEYLKDIPLPEPTPPPQQEMLKMTLLNAKRSSVFGALLVVLPGLLVFLAFLQNVLHLSPGLTRWFANVFSSIPLPARAVVMFAFLVGFPFIAVVLNILAIVYYRFNVIKKELTIVVRMRWPNILVAIAGAALASFYVFHLLADSLLSGK